MHIYVMDKVVDELTLFHVMLRYVILCHVQHTDMLIGMCVKFVIDQRLKILYVPMYVMNGVADELALLYVMLRHVMLCFVLLYMNNIKTVAI